MDYRREIDGLRALAVLPVILFHAGFESFGGGFVGVDVFFVISGYLITTIILAELEQGKFSIVEFYERRARRILPALFFVMLVCTPFAWFWLLPSDMKDFSKSMAAVSVFVSNIYFWHQSGYFDTVAELKPLLHTWSLAVEEQYYVLFPLFLMFFWKSGKRWILVALGVLFVASLTVAQWAAYAKPDAAFYLLPTRGWELLIGSFAAFYLSMANRKDLGKTAGEVGGWLGVALILYAVFAYSKATPFPTLYALVPTLGAALVILFATQHTTVGKFVGNKVFVSVGLVSYSAYLWHQPLFAFARHRSLNEPSQDVFLALSVLALALAYCSWKFVETPFRNRSKFKPIHILSLAVVLGCFFILFGLVGRLSDGFSGDRVKGSLQLSSIPDVTSSHCHTKGLRSSEQLKQGDFCIVGDGPLSLAIIGDSHAGALFTYADVYLRAKHTSALAVSGGYCAPLLNGFAAAENCKESVRLSFDHILNNPEIKKVVLFAAWAIYTKGFRDNDKPSAWRDDEGKASNPTENVEIFRRSLRKTLDLLERHNKDVIIVFPVPEFPKSANQFIGRQMLFNNVSISAAADMLPKISIGDYYTRNSDVFDVFGEVKNRVRFFEVQGMFCRDKFCFQAANGVSLYSDTNHLNFNGAKILVPELIRFVQRDLPTR